MRLYDTACVACAVFVLLCCVLWFIYVLYDVALCTEVSCCMMMYDVVYCDMVLCLCCV